MKIGHKKILLIDVDSKIPNLALMKLSTFYKAKGFTVELKQLGYTYYPKERNQCMIDGGEYTTVFVSIIFKINKNVVRVINCEDVQVGGVGHSLNNELAIEIEQAEPDYSLYSGNDCSYGFITRGCIRNCYFCVVPKKEGMIRQVNTPSAIIKHKRVKFFDNNILAFKDHKRILQELIKLKVRCQFNQGLDIRLLTDENAFLLSQLNYLNEYIFAFDNVKDEPIINEKLSLFKKYVSKDWRVKFFLYCHPDMDIQTDVVYRVEWCKKNKVLPYFMRDQSCWSDEQKDFYTDLCAYCNQVSLFKKLTFEQFMRKRTKNVLRQAKSIKLYGVSQLAQVFAKAIKDTELK